MTARKDGLLKFMQTCTVYPEPTGAEDAECGGGLIGTSPREDKEI